MAKLEDVLKAQGFTDEDIAAQATLLNDPKFRGALEKSYDVLESTLNNYKTENEGWAKWHEDHGKPTLALYEKDMTDAKAEAASLRERLRLAEQNGFAPRREEEIKVPSGETKSAPEAFDPKKHNLVTQDDVAKFADMEGRAIAMAADLNEEYRHLTGGKSLFDYTVERDGRTLRGMVALREEAIQARKPLDQYVGEKFDFQGKRQAIAEAQRKAAEDAIRADERSKVMGQYGDPNQRPMMPSRDPFIPRPPAEKAKMPWEITSTDRRNARVQRAMESQYKTA